MPSTPSQESPRLVLAPMEGLADDVLRDILTRPGGYDWCVTEFIRVTTTVLPHSSYQRVCPELKHASRTRSGTPVRLQLLGSDPAQLAANAAHLSQLNPAGIDLNFGCPTPLVNRNRGGAALLDEPELLHRIARKVRDAVPPAIPVTAKMRLGISDTARALDCALALEAGGVQELVVHARTKEDGYRPPARWEWVARIRQVVRLPVIANGEVWTVADYRAIRDATGCADVMLGRGAVADPLLARRIRGDRGELPDAADWELLGELIADFWTQAQAKVLPHQSPGRLKQWLGLMRRSHGQAHVLYGAIREQRTAGDVSRVLASHGIPTRPGILPG
ncbi:MAG: tRNA-dihydrouridine synthase family protein [Gammaproteobacteria bacterium]|nr:tRNA-dihydrouridine synthase family protein [Gammaproteobacteria bacterium]MBU1646704.1 tRNA-dihydrouridine synthase family protein [Gammaproteobacteria bacterium]MBU1971737.1 tRNA-dihydrouridine synthase family protein [Gammaproteobacteria bacterium]